jgi:uncharacterized membrane protein YccC
MLPLSTRSKEAIKTGLAMTIAYGISLGMGWKNAYWAGFGVAMISLSTVGQSLNKGAMRMLGTLVAGAVALIFIALFVQDRWWFIAVLSVYLGLCTYMHTGKKRTYFWWCCAFVCLVICAHAVGEASNAFDIAVLRVQQTGMGILVYTLVSVLLWPSSTRGALDEATRKLFTTQTTIYRTYRDLLNGHGMAEDSRPLRLQEVQLLSQREQALRAAETDSYEVWELRHQWWRFHRQSTDLMEALEHWRQSFTEIQPLDRSALLPNLEAVCTELDLRFEEIERMLTGNPPTRTPQTVTLVIDSAAMNALTHFQRAAVAVTKAQLDRLGALSRSLFDCVKDIKGHGGQVSSALPEDTRAGGGPGLDPDRLQAAVRAMAATWAAFVIWFYVVPSGHEVFVEWVLIFVMVAAMLRVDPATIVKPFLLGFLLGGVLYVFVMPHLSGYVQLGAMIFGATFAIYYLLWQPPQALARLAIAAMFLSAIDVQNQQIYDFAHYANKVASIALAGGLAIAIWYLPPSPRPEKVFLRLLARFFRHSEHLMSRLTLDWGQKKGMVDRWKTVYYRSDLLELPGKLAAGGQQIDHRAFPYNSPEQVQALVTSLHALAYRLKDLVDARGQPQAEPLVRELLDDVRTWRQAIEVLFRGWAEELEAEPAGKLEEQLDSKLSTMEKRINETFNRIEPDKLNDEDYVNFYRSLGTYRGLSEALVGYAQFAQGINWTPWREARF